MSVKRWIKSRINYIHFGYSDFHDFDYFVMKMLENLKADTRYSILLKINFNKDRYAMAEKQIGLNYPDIENLGEFENLHRVFKKRIESTLDNYEVFEINSIQILFVVLKDMPELMIENVDKVSFVHEFTKKDNKDRFSIIPLTINMNYFGKIILNDNDRLLILNKINKQRDILDYPKLSLNKIDKMYLYKDDMIILNSVESDNIYSREVYDFNSGLLISEIKDRIIGDNHFVREIGNASLTVMDNKIAKIESVKALSPIKFKPKSLKDEANQFIGSWDIETFEDVDGYAKVYALGFAVLNEEVKTYYLDNNLTSEQLVINCLNDMIVNKYNGYTFYTHNFGGYDSTFLIKILKEENLRLGYEHYKMKELCRDNKILKLVIKVKRSLSDRKQPIIGARKDPGYNLITIVDSWNILNQKLSDLCRSFGTSITKGSFPYSFVKRNTLNYVGNTPNYEYWKDISLDDYNELIKPDWNLKNECLKYLERDLLSLLMIMNKFSEYINRKYHLQVTDSLTISRLALNIFLKDYLNDSKLPIITRNMFDEIKEAYYGGLTEVYRPYGKKLLHYDVNSLYPFAALNPMPGINCNFIENINNSINLRDLFGFFYCEIEAVNNYLGLLPVHSDEGLIMPNGNWKGWYFSEELKYASEKGYRINVIKGYNFNKVDNVFTKYVNDLYNIKSTTQDSVEKDIAKRLLNHLLGRFGLNIVKPITSCVNEDELSLILSSRKIVGKPIEITKSDYWVTYYPQIDPDICKDHGLDYNKVQNLTSKTDPERVSEFRDVSLTTAAAVTAYARIYMSKVKLNILEKGGNIYYTDTDSIVTDKPLDSNLIGTELGKFKLEYKIKQGYYISNKTYYIDLAEKLIDPLTKKDIWHVIKSKTVDSKSLSLDDFKNLYKGQDAKANKRFAEKDHSKGSVLIKEGVVDLKSDSYTKRQKVYKRGKWIDTKPLVLDERNNSINKIGKNTKGSKKYKDSKKDKLSEKKKLSNKYMVSTRDIMISRAYYLISWVSFFLLGLTNIITIIALYLVSHDDILNELDFSRMEYNFDTNFNTNFGYSEELLELRYQDDYLEEPLEVEICKDSGYIDKFIDFFTHKGHKSYNFYKDLVCPKINTVQEVPIGYSDNKIYSNKFSDRRPQILSTILKCHLDNAYVDLADLNNKVTSAEERMLLHDIALHDILSIYKKALRVMKGETSSINSSPITQIYDPIRFSTPILRSYNTSPVLEQSPGESSSLKYGVNTSFIGDYSPIIKSNSPIVKSYNDILERSQSPILRGNSPLLDRSSSPLSGKGKSVVRNYSPLLETNTPNTVSNVSIIESNSPNIGAKTPIMKYSGLMIDNQSSIVDNSSIVSYKDYTKMDRYPIRSIKDPSELKRYGNIWPDNINIERYKPINRYGRIWPRGISILDHYNPLSNRYGQVWPVGIPLLKEYCLINEHIALFKSDNSDID